MIDPELADIDFDMTKGIFPDSLDDSVNIHEIHDRRIFGCGEHLPEDSFDDMWDRELDDDLDTDFTSLFDSDL
jgi:hypothetical protein